MIRTDQISSAVGIAKPRLDVIKGGASIEQSECCCSMLRSIQPITSRFQKTIPDWAVSL